MAEPARQFDNSEEQERAKLRDLGGGGQGGGPASSRDNIKAAPDPVYDTKGNAPVDQPGRNLRSVPDKDQLNNAENSGGQVGGLAPQHEGAFERGYTGQGSPKGLSRFSLKGRLSRRRAVVGGGVLAGGIITAAVLFTTVSGPLEFIHFAQTLTRFHFSAQNDTQDGRFLKEVRFFRYAKSGQLEKTRLNVFANKWADSYEAKIGTSGLSSAYSPIFQNFDGYVVDRSQFKNPDGSQMSDDKIKATIKDQYGVEAIDGDGLAHNPGLKGRLVVSSRDLSALENIKLTYGLLRAQGLNKLSAINGTRLLIVRDGVTLHPIKILKTKGETAAELKKAAYQSENQDISSGSTTEVTATDSTENNSNSTENQKSSAASAKEGGEELVKAGEDLASSLESGGDESSVKSSASSLKSGFLNAGLLYGTACVVNGINKNAATLEQIHVVEPLIRMAMWTIALGSQIQSGQGIDLDTLHAYAEQLDGIDSSNNQSSWINSESIQANLGHANTGVPPDSTLKSINANKVPFPWMQPFSGAVDVACSTPVVAAGVLVGFLGGDIATVALDGLKQALATDAIDRVVSLWASGTAIDPVAVGADRGNEADFGAALAANDHSIAAGGVALSTSQQSVLNNLTNQASTAEFNSHSLAYRIFDPYDQRTAISSLIDNSSTSVTQNIAKMGSAMLNIGHIFGSIGSLFSPKAQAASAVPYDYGFPIYGFSASELNDSRFENPYQNACYVVGGCKDPDTGQPISGFLSVDPGTGQPSPEDPYLKKATACFDVKIAPDANGNWAVTSLTSDENNKFEVYNKNKYPADCANPTGLDPTNWQRLRFFILDEETADSMGCYAGDTQGCTNIGANANDISSSGSGSGATGSTDTGDNSQLAQKILDYRSTGQYKCDNPGDCTDLQKVASNQSIAGSDGCKAQNLDPKVLQLILYLIEVGNFKIGTYALCGDHSFDSLGGHSGGHAVDIDSINGVFVNNDSAQAKSLTLGLDQYLNNNLPSDLNIKQLISFGYGNHQDSDLQAQQRANGQLCTSSCLGFYGISTELEHMNHVHVGF
ncbi:MAG TPA: hypothetical protein VFT49_03400 [Candidatus Saccharimonadales bacterium]|nr:hypothetical protein [Candidatus Saccharimonadales bacterium]